MNEEALAALFGDLAQRYGPPTKVFMSYKTFLTLRKMLSRYNTRENRKRILRHRKAIGRGRW